MTPLLPALRLSLRKLDPRVQLRNPVMFVVEVGAALTTIAVISQIITGNALGGTLTASVTAPATGTGDGIRMSGSG